MHDLSWWSHGATFKTPMRVLDLGGYDAILGMDWLKLHSPMTTDWQKKFISFPYQGHHVTLHGVPRAIATYVHELPVEQFAKWSKGNDIWAVAVIQSVPQLASDTPVLPYPAPIAVFLSEFDDVFSEPKELPPQRQYDHAIPLKSGADLLMLDHIAIHQLTKTKLSVKFQRCWQQDHHPEHVTLCFATASSEEGRLLAFLCGLSESQRAHDSQCVSNACHRRATR
jgi:hypothetical protein